MTQLTKQPGTNPYESYDYENYQETYVNQPLPIRRLMYRTIGRFPKKILSIGCGNGYIEKPLAAAGHEVSGFELSDNACRLAREKGIRCERRDVLSIDLAEYSERFDWIIAFDLWEHVIESRWQDC